MTQLADQKRVIESHQRHWPVQVVPIANELGLRVYRRTDWPDNISGRIFRAGIDLAGTSGYAIEVNYNHHSNRRRFTIAHEIAHFVLHPNLIGDNLYEDGLYRSGLSNRVEAQANRFAQRILMPDHLVQEALAQYGSDPKTLADAFEVSEAAMRIRLGLPPQYD
jgi:Zn-dependent peptidase ImmA (M78 family)